MIFEQWEEAGRQSSQRLGWNPKQGRRSYPRVVRSQTPRCSSFVIHALPLSKLEYAISIAPVISEPRAFNPITYNSSDSQVSLLLFLT